jgi:predicted peroxiredoxin
MKRPEWADRTAVVIASGPSLSDEQLEHVQSVRWDREACRVIAVNNTCSRVPWADCAYFGDYLALKCYVPKLRPPVGDFQGEWWTQDKAGAERWGLNYVKSANRPGLGAQRVHLNGNSGAQAVNLATLFGAKRVLLLGFDMQSGPKGQKHWFGSHPVPLVQDLLFDEWIKKFEHIATDAKAMGVEIINCTPGSALPWFPMADIREAL